MTIADLAETELRTLLAFAEELANLAAAAVLPYFRAPLPVENKASGEAPYDPVTAADRAAEQVIRARIMERFPDHGIFGEEFGWRRGESRWTWVIDPIDGTRSFIAGIPLWSILIALNDGTRPVLGLMDQPYLGERFAGSPLGAWLDARGERIALRSRACPELDQAILMAAHPSIFVTDHEQAVFAALSRRVRLSRFGGDGYGYCMLAHGCVDLVVESSLEPYDVQALIPIVEAAGGVITSWSGGPADAGGQVVAAGDPRLHAAVLEILRPAAL